MSGKPNSTIYAKLNALIVARFDVPARAIIAGVKSRRIPAREGTVPLKPHNRIVPVRPLARQPKLAGMTTDRRKYLKFLRMKFVVGGVIGQLLLPMAYRAFQRNEPIWAGVLAFGWIASFYVFWHAFDVHKELRDSPEE